MSNTVTVEFPHGQKLFFTPIHIGHTFYRRRDFAKEEIARNNEIVAAVLGRHELHCKYCGYEKGEDYPAYSCSDHLSPQ